MTGKTLGPIPANPPEQLRLLWAIIQGNQTEIDISLDAMPLRQLYKGLAQAKELVAEIEREIVSNRGRKPVPPSTS